MHMNVIAVWTFAINHQPKEDSAAPEVRPTKKVRTEEEDDDEATERICKLYKCLLRSELDNLVRRKDPETVKALAKLFPASEYPAEVETEHCFYCCTSFDPRDGVSACCLEHEVWNCKRTYKGSHGSEWSATCRRCHEEFSGSSDYHDDPPEDLCEGYCYKGCHDASEEACEEVYRWHTEECGEKNVPFDCKLCEAQRLQFLRSRDSDEDE